MSDELEQNNQVDINNPKSVEIAEPDQKVADKRKISHIIFPLVFILIHMFVLAGGLIASAFILVGPDKARAAIADLGFAEWFQNVALNPDVTHVGSLIGGLILIPVFYLFLVYRRKRYPRVFLTQKPQLKDFGKTQVFVFGILGLSVSWMVFLQFTSNYSEFIRKKLAEYYELTQLMVGKDQNLLLLVVSSVVVVPVLEELLYRGIVMGELRHVMSNRLVVWVQALIFGFIHGNFVQAIYTFFFAVVIGHIYLKTQSIALCVLSHMVFNFIGGALPQFLPESSIVFFVLQGVEFVTMVLLLVYLANGNLWSKHDNRGA